MSSIKCAHCGLANFSTSVTCKRCNNVLAPGAGSTVGHQPPNARPIKDGVAATSIDQPAPPRTLGILIAVLGGVLSFAGVYLLVIGGASPYFLVAGIGIAASGVLIAAGKRVGMYLYFATFGVMFIWSLIETEGNAGKMMSRLFLAVLIGLYLATEKVRARLN